MSHVLTICSSALHGNVGWAYALSDGQTTTTEVGTQTDGTAYRGALEAAVHGLTALSGSQTVLVRTSNDTLAHAGERWLELWRRRDFDKKGGIQHLDLVKLLAAQDVRHRLSWSLHSSREPAFKELKSQAKAARLSLPEVSVTQAAPGEPKSAVQVAATRCRTVAYTDGGCRGNPGGVGGWGLLLIDTRSGQALEKWGAEAETTNNRMEMCAAIEALRCLRGPSRELEIRTDSKYLVDMATTWIHRWRARGWTRGEGGPIANLDLVQVLDGLQRQHRVTWTWVRGHQGEPGNEFVDGLANRAMDELSGGAAGAGQVRHGASPVVVAVDAEGT